MKNNEILKIIEAVTVIKKIINKSHPDLHIFKGLVGIFLSRGIGLIFININKTIRNGIKTDGNINADKCTLFANAKIIMQSINIKIDLINSTQF